MTAVAEEVVADAWVQPDVYQGQEVLFYPHGHRAESPHRAVVVTVWPDFGCRLQLVSGGVGRTHTQKVRHMDDPYFQTHAFSKDRDGAWVHTEYTEKVSQAFDLLSGQIDELSAKVAELEAQISGEPKAVTKKAK